METQFTRNLSEATFAYFVPGDYPVTNEHSITITKPDSPDETYLFRLEVMHYVASNVKQLIFHLPQTIYLFSIIQEILNQLAHFKERAKEVKVTLALSAEFVGENKEIKFSHSVYFYTQNDLSESERSNLELYLKEHNFSIQVRGPKYMEDLKEKKRKTTFISHDFRDKDLVAEPLAKGLEANGCPVWFNSIDPGQNILEAIENGIRESKKCILVITPNYLSNVRYAKREFEAIIAREMIKKERVFIPVWYDVTDELIGDNYSLSLAGLYAECWPSKDGKSPEKYQEEVNDLITKLSNFLRKKQ